jgi:hypothetical protein
MASDLRQQLDRLKSKAGILTERYSAVKQERNAALAEVAKLQETVTQQQKTIESLQRQIEFQMIATTIAPTRKDVDKSRAVLTELVREIETCIADLTE